MTTEPMQADGGKADAAADDATQAPPNEAGESQGGAYPNPRRGKIENPKWAGFFGHGGQSDIGYDGPDNPNATTDPH